MRVFRDSEDALPKENKALARINNRYAVEKKIGSGGMANVYYALDMYFTPPRPVAIKVMKSETAKEQAQVDRFGREIHALSRVKSEYSIQYLQRFEYMGRPGIAMEYVPEHKTLKQIVRARGAIMEEEAVEIMKKITLALIAAHETSVIHRDIKPQNILITTSGDTKLCDFGIATFDNSKTFTKTKEIVGSVQYLPPEVVNGAKADRRSDIYSAGVVLWEALTGQPPFDGDTPIEIARKHTQLSVPHVKTVNSSVSTKLGDVVKRATSMNRNRRYQSATEFYQDLCDYNKPGFRVKDVRSEKGITRNITGSFMNEVDDYTSNTKVYFYIIMATLAIIATLLFINYR